MRFVYDMMMFFFLMAQATRRKWRAAQGRDGNIIFNITRKTSRHLLRLFTVHARFVGIRSSRHRQRRNSRRLGAALGTDVFYRVLIAPRDTATDYGGAGALLNRCWLYTRGARVETRRKEFNERSRKGRVVLTSTVLEKLTMHCTGTCGKKCKALTHVSIRNERKNRVHIVIPS